ncbi:hypothetical protein [Bradyrhizobium sp. dw_411]|uniref:hypothetical protein n=1 Tax=Bradyrhizobium sp. dw_411 TaxID=2720082 RepID=UPI001BD0807F|nr:hypothetical protein [Bradyrhizobium sp. dw_411]
MIENDLVAKARAIIARLDAATLPVTRTVLIRGADGTEWRPRPANCHSNVATWVHHKPDHKHVPGYVIFRPLPPLTYYWEVAAHAVVEIEDGSLVDITPSGASQMYPFIRHEGSIEDFQAFADAVSVRVPV